TALHEHAHAMVRIAISNGTLVRQPCRECGKPKTHAHHDDYSRPLDVVWLCHLHHQLHHRSIQTWRRGAPSGNRPGAKITEAEVAAIRHSKDRVVNIAAQYGLHRNHVYKIRSGLKWGS